MDTEVLAGRLRALVGADAVLTDRQELRTYECDGLAHDRVVPARVVLAASTADVAATVTECARAGWCMSRAMRSRRSRMRACWPPATT